MYWQNKKQQQQKQCQNKQVEGKMIKFYALFSQKTTQLENKRKERTAKKRKN